MRPFLLPPAGEIHLHYPALPHHEPELTRLERQLSPAEAVRAERLKSPLARNRFIAGRGMLRRILGQYLGIDPADVEIAAGEHGKPFLADSAANLRFNVSHADEILVLAVTVDVEIGVDIERIDAGKDIHAMARLAFSRQEQEELLAMPAAQQVEAFHRCWVRKEACLKACGRGFVLPGGSFSVSLRNEAPAEALVCCNEATWHVLDIDAPHNYCGALAFEARASDILSPKPVIITSPKPL